MFYSVFKIRYMFYNYGLKQINLTFSAGFDKCLVGAESREVWEVALWGPGAPGRGLTNELPKS